MLADGREELTQQRVLTVNRLQRLLAEPTPGQAKLDVTALQAKAILASVPPETSWARRDAGWPPNNSPSWSRWRRRPRH